MSRPSLDRKKMSSAKVYEGPARATASRVGTANVDMSKTASVSSSTYIQPMGQQINRRVSVTEEKGPLVPMPQERRADDTDLDVDPVPPPPPPPRHRHYNEPVKPVYRWNSYIWGMAILGLLVILIMIISIVLLWTVSLDTNQIAGSTMLALGIVFVGIMMGLLYLLDRRFSMAVVKV